MLALSPYCGVKSHFFKPFKYITIIIKKYYILYIFILT